MTMALRDLVRHNFWLKLSSVFLATVVWFVIKYGSLSDTGIGHVPILNPVVQDNVEVLVRVLKHPGDARIFKVTPETIEIMITGESAILRNFSKEDFNAYVELANARPLPSTNQEVRLHVPQGVTVLNASPRAVVVEQVSP